MHRVIAGCNLWALLFLAVALVLGALGSPSHQAFGIFAAVFALLAQSAIFALFMGASKLVKEHVERYALGPEHIARTNRIMLPLFAWASTASGLLLVFAILAGLGASGEVPVLVHAVVGVLAMAVLAVALTREVPAMARMHQVLLAMESALPESSEPQPVPPPIPGEPPDRRARALFYVGSTVLVMLLGYRYIAGITLPPLLTALVAGGSVLCLLLSALAVRSPSLR